MTIKTKGKLHVIRWETLRRIKRFLYTLKMNAYTRLFDLAAALVTYFFLLISGLWFRRLTLFVFLLLFYFLVYLPPIECLRKKSFIRFLIRHQTVYVA